MQDTIFAVNLAYFSAETQAQKFINAELTPKHSALTNEFCLLYLRESDKSRGRGPKLVAAKL